MQHCNVPESPASNFVQLPVLLVFFVVPAALKRRFCDRHERMARIWWADIWRLLLCNSVALWTILAVAKNFDGNDCVNYYTLITVDLCLGMFLEIILLNLLKSGNFELGYYGPYPGKLDKKIKQTLTVSLLSFSCRCVSSIAAVCLFPLINGTLQSQENMVWGHEWTMATIITPGIYHFFRLCCFDHSSAVRPPSRSSSMTDQIAFSITGTSDEEDDREYSANSDLHGEGENDGGDQHSGTDKGGQQHAAV